MYTPNNIEFRIVSSNAIAQYKLDQAFDFNELVNTTHFKFSQYSREIMLLNYDMWFKFVNRIEKLFIKHKSNSDLCDATIDAVVMMLDDTLTGISDITYTHPQIFDPYTKKILDKTNNVFFKRLQKTVVDAKNKTIYIAYPLIVHQVSRCLHNLLFQLQECEHLIDKRPDPFISCTSESGSGESDVCPLVHRAMIYRDTFKVNEFIIKDYNTSSDISSTLKKELESHGFIVSKIIHC